MTLTRHTWMRNKIFTLTEQRPFGKLSTWKNLFLLLFFHECVLHFNKNDLSISSIKNIISKSLCNTHVRFVLRTICYHLLIWTFCHLLCIVLLCSTLLYSLCHHHQWLKSTTIQLFCSKSAIIEETKEILDPSPAIVNR